MHIAIFARVTQHPRCSSYKYFMETKVVGVIILFSSSNCLIPATQFRKPHGRNSSHGFRQLPTAAGLVV